MTPTDRAAIEDLRPLLRELRSSSSAVMRYDCFSDAIVWSDEVPSGVRPSKRWVLRKLWFHRTALMHGESTEYAALWEFAREHIPEWAGFLPERLVATEEIERLLSERRGGPATFVYFRAPSNDERSVVKVWTHGVPLGDDVDLHVQLDDGSVWVSTFMTPERARQYLTDSREDGYPDSEYISDPFMVTVSRIDLGLLADIAAKMLRDGDFFDFFTRCKSVSVD